MLGHFLTVYNYYKRKTHLKVIDSKNWQYFERKERGRVGYSFVFIYIFRQLLSLEEVRWVDGYDASDDLVE
jgi:hypothetical protein